MDNSGTKMEATVRELSDTRERTGSEFRASRRAADTAARAHALLAQFRDISAIRGRKRPYDDVDVRENREHFQPYDFTQPAFHAIAIDRVVRILRHDDAGPCMTQKGSDVPNLEMRGSDSLPLQADRLERAFPRQPKAARKAAMVRCPRT